MNKFLINSIQFALIGVIPLAILLFIYILLDPFRVIYTYDTLYDLNTKGRVGFNKDYISTTTFLNNRKKSNLKYNSFIFGNSRSIFYQISDWKKHLSPESICYHFDAWSESLWALNKKIEYIDNMGIEIENVLLILDYETLIQDNPKSGHLYIISPVLVNNSNTFEFHATFFRAFLYPKFLYAFFDFWLSGKVKPYMVMNDLLENTPRTYDLITNEMKFDYFEELIRNNHYYTSERLSLFYSRDTIQNYSPISIKENQKIILNNINRVFKKHNTKAKIVISPLYNQEKISTVDLNILKELFGTNNVFDFSGINKITSDYKNYYEKSHYRPHAAREIIEEIYKYEIKTNE